MYHSPLSFFQIINVLLLTSEKLLHPTPATETTFTKLIIMKITIYHISN